MELPDPRLTRGNAANGRKAIGLALLDLIEDIEAGRIDVREMFFCPAKPPHQRTAKAQGTWIITIKGHGTGEPLQVDKDEFTGALL